MARLELVVVRRMSAGEPRDRARDDERIWTLLDRFLAGDAGADEVRAVRDWLAADPARGAVLAELQRVRAVVGHPPPPRGVDAAWTDLLSALRAAPDE